MKASIIARLVDQTMTLIHISHKVAEKQLSLSFHGVIFLYGTLSGYNWIASGVMHKLLP